MAEPFKNLINAETVRHTALHLKKAWPAFPRAHFEKQATQGLESLEMKARAMHIATALEAHLPPAFAAACDVLEASLAPPKPFTPEGEPVGLAATEHGVSGWVIWSFGEFVARRGMHDVPRALQCLHALTQRFSAEFAIRYFLEKHPKETLATLKTWVGDPSPHVRRLVSEGSRTRLPWGIRLHAFIANPVPTLRLVRTLQDDPSSYVRRSVANHLNDIAKDHPALIASWVHEHLPNAPKERIALLRHASRGLVKRGDPDTLKAWGVGHAFYGSVALSLTPKRACIGEHVALCAVLTSKAKRKQALIVDYVVHYVTAKGKPSAKVRKGWKLQMDPGETRTLTKKHSLKVVTTRKLYPGAHRLEILINGTPQAEAVFLLHKRVGGTGTRG